MNLTVITGPMFSGKTERLLWEYNRLKLAGQKPIILKPSMDTRTGGPFSLENVSSRSGWSEPASIVWPEHKGTEYLAGASHIMIDEAWMIDWHTLQRIMAANKPIVLTALNSFHDGSSVPITANLMALADDIIFLKNICSYCGADGSRTYKTEKGDLIEIGDNQYRAACKGCWSKKIRGEIGGLLE